MIRLIDLDIHELKENRLVKYCGCMVVIEDVNQINHTSDSCRYIGISRFLESD